MHSFKVHTLWEGHKNLSFIKTKWNIFPHSWGLLRIFELYCPRRLFVIIARLIMIFFSFLLLFYHIFIPWNCIVILYLWRYLCLWLFLIEPDHNPLWYYYKMTTIQFFSVKIKQRREGCLGCFHEFFSESVTLLLS